MAKSKTVSTAGFIAAMVIIMMMATSCRSTSSRCKSRVRMCIERYSDIFFSNVFPVITIDRLCNQITNFSRSDCFGDCLEEAQQTASYAFLLIFDYACVPAKINEIKFVVEESSCLRDALELSDSLEHDCVYCERKLVTRSIYRQIDGVFDNGNPSADLGDVCPTINNVAACFFDKVRQRCGSLIMPLVKAMVRVGVDHLTSVFLPSCQLVVDDGMTVNAD